MKNLHTERTTTDSLELYRDGKEVPFLMLKSSFQPQEGDLINVRKVTYVVVGRSFTVDHAGQHDESIRCNVIVKERK